MGNSLNFSGSWRSAGAINDCVLCLSNTLVPYRARFLAATPIFRAATAAGVRTPWGSGRSPATRGHRRRTLTIDLDAAIYEAQALDEAGQGRLAEQRVQTLAE